MDIKRSFILTINWSHLNYASGQTMIDKNHQHSQVSDVNLMGFG